MTETPIPTGAPTQAIRDLADEFHLLVVERSAAKATLEEVEARYDVAQARLFDAIEAAGLRSVRTGAGMFSLNDLAWPRIADPSAALAWAEANAPEFITLNHQRLISPVREAIKEGRDLPPGVDFTTSRKIRYTAAR